MKYNIELDGKSVTIKRPDGSIVSSDSKEAFEIAKKVWLYYGWEAKYVYSFSWLGRPIIQLPDDMIRAQEIIWKIKPTLIIETGVAHGGSLIFYASMLKLINGGRVIGIDIDIRKHNREAIKAHDLSPMITLIEGDATNPKIFDQVRSHVKKSDVVLIFLDSCHSKEHVLKELQLYSELVTRDSYIVAADGIMEELAGASRTSNDWAWNNPKEAVKEFLNISNTRFMLDTLKPCFNESFVDSSPTYWPDAWLKRIL